MRRFVSFFEQQHDQLTKETIRRYLLELLHDQKSHSYVNQAVSAIKFLLHSVCRRPDLIVEIPRPKQIRKLPNVLSYNEVYRILDTVQK